MIKLVNNKAHWKHSPAKYHIPRSSEREIALSRNNEKINFNLSVLKNKGELQNKYPYLYKITRRIIHYICDINEFSSNKLINDKSKKDGLYYFFVSCRYLEKYFKYAKYNTWNRNINIFCTIGLIKKYHPKKVGNIMAMRATNKMKKLIAKKLGLSADEVNDINYYTIPEYDLNVLLNADLVCKKLVESRFRINSFSKSYLIKNLGNQFANSIFMDDRYISDYSNYVSNEIEKYILFDINENGFTTKDRVINQVKINFAKVNKCEYGFIKPNSRAIIEREFNNSITDIINRNGLEYRKANKELLEKFNFQTFKFIIFRK